MTEGRPRVPITEEEALILFGAALDRNDSEAADRWAGLLLAANDAPDDHEPADA